MAGKRTRAALYIHRSWLSALAQDDRRLVTRASAWLSPVMLAGWNVVKVVRSDRKVSFLCYAKFDTDPHPALAMSALVNLREGDMKVTEYKNKNPYILHRKELLVPASYPRYEKFRRQTEKEERRGLLSRKDIGTRRGWAKALKEAR